MDTRVSPRNKSHYNLRSTQRLAQQQQQTQTQPVPAPPAFRASSSVSSISSVSSESSQTTTSQGSPEFTSATTFSSAPVPSPSQTRQSHYFEPLPSQMAMYMDMEDQHQPQYQQQQYMQPEVQYQQPYQQEFYYQQPKNSYEEQRTSFGSMAETAPYLKDFNLLAEAAKRAQMACLMRDIDDMEL